VFHSACRVLEYAIPRKYRQHFPASKICDLDYQYKSVEVVLKDLSRLEKRFAYYVPNSDVQTAFVEACMRKVYKHVDCFQVKQSPITSDFSIIARNPMGLMVIQTIKKFLRFGLVNRLTKFHHYMGQKFIHLKHFKKVQEDSQSPQFSAVNLETVKNIFIFVIISEAVSLLLFCLEKIYFNKDFLLSFSLRLYLLTKFKDIKSLTWIKLMQ